MCNGAFFSQRTAGGAEHSPTDLVESKGGPGGENTPKNEKERERARYWKCQIYTALQFMSMFRFSSREALCWDQCKLYPQSDNQVR